MSFAHLQEKILTFFETPSLINYYERLGFLSKWRLRFAKFYHRRLLRFWVLLGLELLAFRLLRQKQRRPNTTAPKADLYCFAPTRNNCSTLRQLLELVPGYLEPCWVQSHPWEYEGGPHLWKGVLPPEPLFQQWRRFHKAFWANATYFNQHAPLGNQFLLMEYFLLPYYREIHRAALSFFRPQAVLVANEFLVSSLSLQAEAQAQGLRFIYCQHAQIAEVFPPLTVDVILSEGERSVASYRRINERWGVPFASQVVLIGSLRTLGQTAPLQLPENREEGLVLGLSLSSTSPADLLLKATEQLRNAPFKVQKIIVRPHPKTQPADFRLPDSPPFPLEFRTGHQQSEAQYRQTIDLHIAGNSSIHIDMLSLGTPSLQWQGIDRMTPDYYGFVASGLLPEIEQLSSLGPNLLEHFRQPGWPDLLRGYNANYLQSRATIVDRIKEALQP